MPIRESTLQQWANHVDPTASEQTHRAVRAVLERHRWPSEMTYDLYLQGSYKNGTNIRSDSDVDVVMELTSAFEPDMSALGEHDRHALAASLRPAPHGLSHFRDEVLDALRGAYGGHAVSLGDKAIRIAAAGLPLAADVIACIQYQRYRTRTTTDPGITFWTTRERRQIVNFPSQHYSNGAAKNTRTSGRYKPTVRMFKNARSYLVANRRLDDHIAPSYCLECLIFNAPDSSFHPTHGDTFVSVVNWAATAELNSLLCQNQQQYLFGPTPEQWSVNNAKIIIDSLVGLWNDQVWR